MENKITTQISPDACVRLINTSVCLPPGEYVFEISDNKLAYAVRRGDTYIVTWDLGDSYEDALKVADDAAAFLHEEGVDYALLSNVFDKWLSNYGEIRQIIRERYDV